MTHGGIASTHSDPPPLSLVNTEKPETSADSSYQLPCPGRQAVIFGTVRSSGQVHEQGTFVLGERQVILSAGPWE